MHSLYRWSRQSGPFGIRASPAPTSRGSGICSSSPIGGWRHTSSSRFLRDDVRFTHRWAGAIDTNTRFCAHWGLARDGRVAYVNGFTGLGVGAARFAADVCLDLLDNEPTARTELDMVRRRPVPFPPEPLASIGIQATRWSLDRADHSAGRRNILLRSLDALGLGFDS